MVEITYQMVLSTLQTAGLLVGIFYYLMVLRNQQKTRELSLKAQEEAEKSRKRELVLQRFQGYSLDYTKSFAYVLDYTDWEDAEDWERKYRSDPEIWSKWLYVMRIHNLAGILLKEKMADANLIFQLYPPMSIINVWEQFEPVVRYTRESRKFPALFEPFEFIYNEAKKRHPETLPRSPLR